jgi:hypothetical protein
MAANIPLNPETTFKHISVHVIHILARLQARRLVQEQLRGEGVRASQVSPREVQERATALLHDHPEIWKEALDRAHKLDEMEGQKKARRKLRREQLARLRRSVYESDPTKSATDKSG